MSAKGRAFGHISRDLLSFSYLSILSLLVLAFLCLMCSAQWWQLCQLLNSGGMVRALTVLAQVSVSSSPHFAGY